MRTAWTGGQYSLLRLAFGLALVAAAAGASGPIWLRAVTAASALALAAGFVAPIAALGVLAGWIALAGPQSFVEQPWSAFVQLALLVHALVPRAPFGSVAALGRVDPGGGWRFPSWCAWFAWLGALALAGGAEFVGDTTSTTLPMARLVAAAAGLVAPLRPFAWLVLGFEEGVVHFDAAYAGLSAARILAIGILFDPGWIRGEAGGVERLYYDGSCGLCHRAVRFVLAEDVDGSRFRVAPLHGEAFDAHVPPDRRANLPDSVIVQVEGGRLLVRSDAALHILERLGGAWRVLGSAGRILPRPLRDAAYDGVARIRKRLFAAPKEACPLLPRELRGRFEA